MKQSREEGHAENRRYIMLLLGCAAAVAVVAFVLFAQPQFTDADTLNRYEYTEEDDSVSASDSVERIPTLPSENEHSTATSGDAADADTDADTDDDAEEADETEDTDDTEDAEEAPSQETTAASDTAVPAFTAPMSAAKVVRAYSMDALAYDVTMEDWRTHAATDYGGKMGDDVLAAADGTVLEVGENALYGTYLLVEHSGGMQSRYAGIADLNVAKGDKVKSGQVLAHLGKAMPAEAKQGVHLHFELTKDGNPVNLQEYVKKS